MKSKKLKAKKLIKSKVIEKGKGVFLTDKWQEQKKEIAERVKRRIDKVKKKKAERKIEKPVETSKHRKKRLAQARRMEARRVKREKYAKKNKS